MSSLEKSMNPLGFREIVGRVQRKPLMRRDDDRPPTRPQHPHHLSDVAQTISRSCRRRLRLTDMFDDADRPHEVKLPRHEWEVERRSSHYTFRIRGGTSPARKVARKVDSPNINRGIQVGDDLPDGTSSTADIERSTVTRPQLSGQPALSAVSSRIDLLCEIFVGRRKSDCRRRRHQIDVAPIKYRVRRGTRPANCP